jgi:3-oxoacyl-[acyl-carrier protein] reductase
MERELEGKTALVTGSGRNIGRAIVLELAAKGANVIVNTRSNVEEARAVELEAQALDVGVLTVVGDVSDQATVDAMQASAESTFGGVDILVSNAAVRPVQSFFDMPVDDFVAVLETQLVASFRLARAFVPGMVDKQWGRIIHITGPDAFIGLANRAHNVTAKGGLRALTKSLAIELAPHGITVNDVAPGVIRTEQRGATHPVVSADPQQRFSGGPGRPGASGSSEGSDDRESDRIVRQIPVGRRGEPEEVAYACSFLASPRAGFFTGIVVCCFGGQWMPA